MNDDRQFCTFKVGGFLFGVPVLEVQEVIRYQEITQVPLAPAAIGGLINLRGQIVMAMQLRRRLDFAEPDEGTLPMNVVVNTEEGAISLLVDEIGDVVEVGEETFDTPPDTLQGVAV